MTKTAPLFLSIAFLAISTSLTSAQDYPSRPVELVVPFPAGGGTEIVTRLVGDGLAKRLGQPFVVLNRPGANTNVGTLAVVRSKPDGYTLLITSFGLAANPSLYKKLAFEPQTDLEPITLIANSPTVLTVPLSLPVNSLPEFIAYVKARPGELNYASYGVGSSPHLAAELFQNMIGAKMVHVPYSGGGPAAIGVMTNQVQALFSSVVTVLGMLRGGNAQGHRHRGRPPLGAHPERADLRGAGLGLQDRHLVRPARAGQDPARDHRHAAPRERVGLLPIQSCERESSSRAPTWWRIRPPSSAPSSRTRPSGSAASSAAPIFSSIEQRCTNSSRQ